MGGGGGGGGGGGAGISLLEGKLDGSLFLGGKLDGCCFFIPWFKAHYLIVATVLSASHPHPTYNSVMPTRLLAFCGEPSLLLTVFLQRDNCV